MVKSTWRIVHTPPASGAWNMAVDEAILASVGRGEALPTLRLFDWQPACLSLGYAQPVADVDFSALERFGWGWVRRPTGGRAILHVDELTYSVIAPLKEPRVYGSVLDSYRHLSQALLRALALIGLPARADKDHANPGDIHPGGPVCFEAPSDYEITVDGKKLIGSAQARRREGVLQHGSLPLSGDLSRITWVLAFPDEDSRQAAEKRLLERALTIETCLKRVVTWQEAAQAFRSGFEEALDLEFEDSPLTPEELQRASQLVEEKYGHPDWNKRV